LWVFYSPEVSWTKPTRRYGNNCWATGFGKDQATRVLTQMKQHGLLDTDVVAFLL
jgi:hypothetical protein